MQLKSSKSLMLPTLPESDNTLAPNGLEKLIRIQKAEYTERTKDISSHNQQFKSKLTLFLKSKRLYASFSGLIELSSSKKLEGDLEFMKRFHLIVP